MWNLIEVWVMDHTYTCAFWLNKAYSQAFGENFVACSKFIQTWWSVFKPLIAEKHCEKPCRLPKNAYLIVFRVGVTRTYVAEFTITLPL